MLCERLLDLHRIDVLSAADDHVLDPVGEEEVAVGVEVTAVAGAQPPVCGQRRCGLLRTVEVPRRDVRSAQPHLAGLARRGLRARGRVDDPQLHPRERAAGAAQQVLARPAGIVVGRIELDHAAGRLRQPVDAVERASERAQRRLQDRRRDRRRPVRDRPQRRVVAIGGAGDAEEHLDHRRDEHRVGDALVFDHAEHRVRLELADEHGRRAVPQPEERPADTADVEHRQRGETDRVCVELPVGRRLGRGGEVPVRRQHALRHSRRSRRVELQHRVARFRRRSGIDRVVRGDPLLVA